MAENHLQVVPRCTSLLLNLSVKVRVWLRNTGQVQTGIEVELPDRNRIVLKHLAIGVVLPRATNGKPKDGRSVEKSLAISTNRNNRRIPGTRQLLGCRNSQAIPSVPTGEITHLKVLRIRAQHVAVAALELSRP